MHRFSFDDVDGVQYYRLAYTEPKLDYDTHRIKILEYAEERDLEFKTLDAESKAILELPLDKPYRWHYVDAADALIIKQKIDAEEAISRHQLIMGYLNSKYGTWGHSQIITKMWTFKKLWRVEMNKLFLLASLVPLLLTMTLSSAYATWIDGHVEDFPDDLNMHLQQGNEQENTLLTVLMLVATIVCLLMEQICILFRRPKLDMIEIQTTSLVTIQHQINSLIPEIISPFSSA